MEIPKTTLNVLNKSACLFAQQELRDVKVIAYYKTAYRETSYEEPCTSVFICLSGSWPLPRLSAPVKNELETLENRQMMYQAID